jgi:hypothetical protein
MRAVAADSHGADAHGPRRFEVPVRIGGVASALRGQFVPVPTRTGTLAARLLSGRSRAGRADRARAGRVASFLLQSDAQEPVTVLGRDGEPFVRLSPAGVEANLHSATFADAARCAAARASRSSRRRRPAALGAPHLTPSYGWVDLRTAYPEADVPEKVARGGKRWSCCAGRCRCGSARPTTRRWCASRA